MREPLVSVCIPTRDGARWLSEAIDSALGQTLGDLEVVVCDDASRDDTAAVLAGYDDPRLRHHRHPRPRGVAAARNTCRSLARGRYLAWLDSDDRYLPPMLETQVAVLERHPGAAMAHGGFELIDAEGRRLPDWPPPFPEDAVEPGPEALEQLATQNDVAAPTVVVRRTAQDAAGSYRTDLASGEDWEMWLRLALEGDLVYTSKPVAQYRWHAGSLGRRAATSGAQLERDRRAVTGVLTKNAGRIAGVAAVRRRAGAALASRALLRATDHLTRRRRRPALAAALLALRAHPPLAGRSAAWCAVAAAVLGSEYAWHVASRELLGHLSGELVGSRLARRLVRLRHDAEWQRTLRRIAARIRAVVPLEARVAVADKWDPTLLHLSRRRGWHFPDRALLPDGYPEDSDSAVAHLEQLCRRGARYLVLPCSSFWWLEAYAGLAEHLASRAERLWQDRRCVIFGLPELAPERGTRGAAAATS